MFVVVYRMFEQAHRKIKKIFSKEIIECYEQNEGLMEKLERAHEKFFDRVASVLTSRQPYVVPSSAIPFSSSFPFLSNHTLLAILKNHLVQNLSTQDASPS